MTSSMLAGERRWASARRGGMTVLGKVAVPKPLNLPSQKLENHGLDPNVEIVPKGSLSWGSRPSSSTSNPWGSSVSPNADGSSGTPHHPSGRPSSGGGLSRPSTAGSDRVHEPTASSWGPNSRPSSASGVLTSNQSALTTSRPLSSETRPGSSHLSRFAEPAFDNNMAWGPNGTADKLSIPSKANDFSLSSGDFPTLGSEKDNTPRSSEAHDHGSHVRPTSASGKNAPPKDRNDIPHSDYKTGTVETWTRDGPPHTDKWQGESQQYINPNVPPQHFDTWRGPPPMNAPAGVWYRGPPPPAGPPYPPVPHGAFPMEPFPYYRPHPPNLANSQPGPPGPRGHHPRNGDFYRPQMPDAFIRPNMPMRPGFYPGPVPYDNYYGPPMGYNPNEREMPFMGMPPGPHGPPPGPPGPPGPPVYNMCPPQNPSEINDPHFRNSGRMFAPEQMERDSNHSIPPDEKSRGPYKVLRKREHERDADVDDKNWEQNADNNTRRNEDISSRRNTHVENPNLKPSNENWGKKVETVTPSFSEASHDVPLNNPKDPSLIQKIEGLNAKVRASDVRGLKEEQKNRLLINPRDNSTVSFGSISSTDISVIRGDNSSNKSTNATAPVFSRQAQHGVRPRVDNHNKVRSNNQDSDGWRKKSPILGSDGAASDNHVSAEPAENSETKDIGESMVDPTDGQAQRARMRELAKQRAIQLQKEEEERIKEQKAKALAKLEELNRRTLAAADGTTKTAEKTETSVPEQADVDESQKQTEPVSDDIKHEVPSPVVQVSEVSQQEPVDQSSALKQNDDVSKTAPLQKRVNHRQKQSIQTVESSVDKSALPSQESTQSNTANIVSESTQQRKRNNKSSKNKHKVEEASREIEIQKPQSPESNLDQVVSLPSKPQNTRRMPRNPQANRPTDRFHVSEQAVVWAPVRKEERGDESSQQTVQDDVAVPAKNVSSVQSNNMKSKRAEMERYVPKPVAKELAQQGSGTQSASQSPPGKSAVDDVAEREEVVSVPVTVSVDSNNNNNNKQNKQVKGQNAWRQRGPTEKKNDNKPATQQPEVTNVVPIETNVTTHEWDPSDGWFMPDEIPPTQVTPVTSVVKEESGFTNKGKRPAYKSQRSMGRNHEFEAEVNQTERPTSKENRSSHWQPKPYRSGGQSYNPEVKRVISPEEGRRERKPNTSRGYNNNMEDEASYEQQQQHVSSGYRKYGGGSQNSRGGGQDNRRQHNNNPNINRERPRQNNQNLHYEYQPVGSNNNNNNINNHNKNSNLDNAPSTEGSNNAGQRYKERGSGQPRRGGGNFYGRQ